MPEDIKLNLGCGPKSKHIPGWVNIDLRDDADLRWNLENGTLPYADGTVKQIVASQVFEHINNLIPLMNACHRVLETGGTLFATTPLVNTIHAFSDPTHVRFFTEQSWAYFEQGSFLNSECGESYGIIPWSDIRQEVRDGWELVAVLKK